MRKLRSLLGCTNISTEYTPIAHSSLSSQSGITAVIASTLNISKRPFGHPERLRNWLAEPVDPPAKPSWTGVIHPKQARTQYHALREQVQTLARTQHVRDLASKQVGIDPMPDFPIHAIEGNLSPVMPTILPVQLLPAARKFHPDELGIRENNPPSQLSLAAIQLIQEKNARHPYWDAFFWCRHWAIGRHPSTLSKR